MKVTSKDLADKLSPKLQTFMKDREPELTDSLRPWFLRQAVNIAYPTFLSQIPELTRLVIDLVSTEFGTMNVNDLLAFLDEHTKNKASTHV